MYGQVIRRYKPGKARAEERVKNGSMRMPDGGDFVSGVERVWVRKKMSMESERMNERRWGRESVASGEEENQWSASCCGDGDIVEKQKGRGDGVLRLRCEFENVSK